MRRRLLVGAGVLAALALAFLAGKYSGVAKKIEESDRTAATATATASTEAKHVAADEVANRRTTIRKSPGRPAAPAPASGVCPECPVVDETVIEEEVRKRTLDLSVTAVATTTVSTETEHTSRVTEYSRPRVSVAALAGWRLGDPTLEPQIAQVQVDLRVVSTLWAGVWLQAEKRPDPAPEKREWRVSATGASLRLEF